MATGATRMPSPSATASSTITDPMALPSASSGCPRSAARRDTVSSGEVVANPTSTMPMTIFGTRSRCAMPTAPSTRKSAQ